MTPSGGPIGFSRGPREEAPVITGLDVIIHSRDAEEDLAFLRDVIGLRAVDAGGGDIGMYQPNHPLAHGAAPQQ